MATPRTLASILEPGFVEGYEQFKEVVDFIADAPEGPGLTPTQKAWARLMELVSVAMIEGLNRAETEHGIPPADLVVELWAATGAALATVNAQAFVAHGQRQVRREMITEIKRGYDHVMKAITVDMEDA